jgi:hypothetical protein
MTSKDLFALGVRLFGVWLITRGVTYIEIFADVKLYPTSEKIRDSATGNFIYGTRSCLGRFLPPVDASHRVVELR